MLTLLFRFMWADTSTSTDAPAGTRPRAAKTSRWGYTKADRDRLQLEADIRAGFDEDDDELTWL